MSFVNKGTLPSQDGLIGEMAWRGCGLPEYSETGGRAFNLSLFYYSVHALIKSGGVKIF